LTPIKFIVKLNRGLEKTTTLLTFAGEMNMPIGIQNNFGCVNVAEFVERMGGNFTVGTIGLQTVEDTPREVSTRYLLRQDTNILFAPVGPDYHIIQNQVAFAHLQPFIDSGKMQIVSGGIGRGGRVCYVSGKVIGGDGEVLAGDKIENYFSIINPFDGKKAVYTLFSPRRLGCDNQIRGVVKDKASKMIRIKHSSQVERNLTRVMEIVDLATAEFAANMEQYTWLARRQVSQSDVQKYVKKLWEVDNIKPEELAEKTRTVNILDRVFQFIESGPGQNIPSTRGSWFWLWQGVNGYLNHIDGRDDFKRFEKMAYGENAAFDQKAFDLANEMANAA
jgi:phage/plasmid-like protein (TIGR03299 family)